ncbi:MAG: hypothetical protein MZV63_06230 [Marinilabiliales bacterium]|nr:hypothetical protein [Marinilabiliales bacterium]
MTRSSTKNRRPRATPRGCRAGGGNPFGGFDAAERRLRGRRAVRAQAGVQAPARRCRGAAPACSGSGRAPRHALLRGHPAQSRGAHACIASLRPRQPGARRIRWCWHPSAESALLFFIGGGVGRGSECAPDSSTGRRRTSGGSESRDRGAITSVFPQTWQRCRASSFAGCAIRFAPAETILRRR